MLGEYSINKLLFLRSPTALCRCIVMTQESTDAASDKFCDAVEQMTSNDKYVCLSDDL